MMLVIPAIDIKEGKCVRLQMGNMESEEIFSDSPLNIAKSWASEGAQLIHIVDLDGAIRGKPINQGIIKKIGRELHGIKIQVGGGIRNKDSALSYLEDGIDMIILGTKAVTDPTLIQELCSLYPNRIILAVDFYKGKVKTKGWVEEKSLTPQRLIKRFAKFPLASFIVTDISRDGMMKGPNIKEIFQLSSMTSVPLIASGGIANLEDLKRLKKENNLNEEAKISGVICGRSLYKRSFTLEEAIKIIEN